jgi:hypothetical protein
MSTLGIVITVIGATMIGCGLALGCLIAMNRREIRRRADAARRWKVPNVEHYEP